MARDHAPSTSRILLCAILCAGCAKADPVQDLDTGVADTATDLADTSGDGPVDAPVDTTPDSAPETIPDMTETTPDATGGIVGDPCYTSTQCSGVPGSGRTCLTSLMGYITFPGGYCSAACTSSADCGTGAQCVNITDLGNYCLEQCTMATECRTAETYSCSGLSGVSGTFCIPPMTSPDA